MQLVGVVVDMQGELGSGLETISSRFPRSFARFSRQEGSKMCRFVRVTKLAGGLSRSLRDVDAGSEQTWTS